MRPRLRGVLVYGLAGALIAAGVVVVTHNVPADPTPSDKQYAGLIITQAGYDPDHLKNTGSADFEAEVRAVVAVQDAVLKAAPDDRAIPFAHEREPKDIFELKHGLCFDRSRVIEKLLTWLGYEARHVAVYSTKELSWFRALLQPQVDSHAVTEVKTSKGWMVVDSNVRWVGLDAGRDAISLDELQDGRVREWAPESRDSIRGIFIGPFVHIRGLYSRHGYFYAPYTPVPDFNVGELLENFSD